MKIYESTEYVNPSEQTGGYYQLWAINQWDWAKNAVCARRVGSYDSVGYTTLSYSLLYSGVVGGKLISVEILKLTDEMKDCLRSMGYMVGGSE